jgi:hypothetical protein
MSRESSRTARDVMMTGALQLKLQNVKRANTEIMNEETLWKHIQAINTGLTAIACLQTTSRLDELPKKQLCVTNADIRISELLAEGKQVMKEQNNLKSGAASYATKVKNHRKKSASLHAWGRATQDQRSRTTIGKQNTRSDGKPQTGIRRNRGADQDLWRRTKRISGSGQASISTGMKIG